MNRFSSLMYQKLDPSNLMKLLKFLDKNHLRDEYFHPHPFNMDYLIYLIVHRSKDYFALGMIDDEVVSYGLLRGWEEGYEVPSLGVAVDREYRGIGLGENMCQYLHQVAKIRGCEKVRLRVHKNNNVAKSLYEKLGYEFREFDEEYLEGIKVVK